MSAVTAALISSLELPPCQWELPDPRWAEPGLDVVGIGADIEPSTLITAYGRGIFPMPIRRRTLGWWSPDPRGVLPLDGFRVSRSLRQSRRRFEIRFDTAFDAVIERCANVKRPHGWITQDFIDAYVELHRLGIGHSVETYLNGQLVGGLYGLQIGGLFAGESMFHTATDASKVALVALVELLSSSPGVLLDIQWVTPHLESLGAIEVPRDDYLDRLARAIELPPTPWPVSSSG